ncbi:type IV secretory system conjugative DNA transfer family protein [Xanthobacter sp. TB0136]|uniref:type IV secretory system conjugative DNA transfer family protein n=1 Tax=Xanthobacter sp. TB0136 TaxID=3459177 RepID=UPI0040399FDB
MGTLVADCAGSPGCRRPHPRCGFPLAAHRAKFGRVHILDPFGITGQPTATYNPFEGLAGSPQWIEDGFEQAEAVCPVDASGGASEHFSASARTLIRALILYIVAERPVAEQNLVTLRQLLSQKEADFRATLTLMADHECEAIHGPARQQLARDAREAAGILSTAATNTEWLDSPAVAGSVKSSSFRFSDLKEEVATVFIVLPPAKIDTFSRWLRVLAVSVLREFTEDPLPGGGCLFVVDECAALGRLKALETALSVALGYGLRSWYFFQSAAQIEDIYNRKSREFFASTGTQIFADVSDDTTAKLVSATLGDETVLIGQKPNIQRVSRPLLAPELVRQERDLIVFQRGKPPLRARKIRWWKDKDMAALGRNERS